MIKKFKTGFFLGFFLLFIPLIKTEALDSSLSGTIKKEKIDKIQELKEKVVEKVAQLKNQEDIIFSGKIKEIEDEKIVIVNLQMEEKNLIISKETNFYWINSDGKKLKLTLKDFTEDDNIIAIGKKENEETITAKTIYGRYPFYLLSCKLNGPLLLNKKISCQDQKKDLPYNLIAQDKTKLYLLKDNQDLKTIKAEEILSGDFIIFKGIKVSKNDEFNLITVVKLNFPSPTGSY